MQEEIKRIFEAFNQLSVLVIGDVMIDAYLWGKVDRISPEAPVPVVALKKRESRLGGAANVALNVQSLGAIPYLVSVVGADVRGKEFVELMKEQGLPDDGIVTCPMRPTTTKFRIIGNNFQMLRVDEETDLSIDENYEKILLERILSLIKARKADAIIFEDYDKGVITPGLIEAVVNIAKEHGIPVTVDPKKRNFMAYKGVSMFKPNLKELKEGLKVDAELSNPEELKSLVREFQVNQDVEMVLATLSEKGIFVSRRESQDNYQTASFPAHVRNISDVSGAGDTVISVASLCLALGVEDAMLAQLANLAGGLVCEYVGVVPVNKQELFQEALRVFSVG